MGKRQELEQTAIRLYAEGMEIPAISVETGVSENSLRDWKKRAGSEWDEARAVCRKGYVASFETVGARMARAKELSTQCTGDAKTLGSFGLSLNHALQSMLYDLMDKMQTTDLDNDSRDVAINQANKMASLLLKTEQAANFNLKREQEIKNVALAEAAKKASEAVDAASKGNNKLTPDEFKAILRETYGA